MSKKICISGYYGFDNFGDETVLKVLIDNLKEFDITVFSVSPKNTSENYKVKSKHTFNVFEILKSIYKCDCLISGGGSLLQDATSTKSLFYYLFVILSALFFRKKVIIFAQGIGPINCVPLKYFTMIILKYADYITLRDENSIKLLQKYNIPSKKCADPVWNVQVNKYGIKGKIGVQLRNFTFVNNKFLLKLALNLDKYYKNDEIIILSLQNNLDLEICQNFKNILSNVNPKINAKVIPNNSQDGVIEDISHLETLIAMRYHACLIGIKAGVKVLPINYDIKVKMLAEEFNLTFINSVDDVDIKFEEFVKCEIKYDEEKIKSYKFDFSKLKDYISR